VNLIGFRHPRETAMMLNGKENFAWILAARVAVVAIATF